MRAVLSFVAAAFILTSVASYAQSPKTYTGIVTDTMCGTNHAAMMHVQPDGTCVQECVKHPANKLALADGKNMYVLSDQKTPVKFAGQKVKVTGSLNPKTNVLRVDRIETTK